MFLFFFLFEAYFILKERESTRGGRRRRRRERERESERASQACFTLSAQSWMRGWIPPTMRSWPEPKSRVVCLTDRATQAPQYVGASFVPKLFLMFHHINCNPKWAKPQGISSIAQASMRNYIVWEIGCALALFKRNLREEGMFQAIKCPLKTPKVTLWSFRFCIFLSCFHLSFFSVNHQEIQNSFLAVLPKTYQSMYIHNRSTH